MIFDIGPFQLYRVEKNGTLDISLKTFPELPWGWEYGWADPMAERKPLVCIRVGKLVVLSFETFHKGFELWFMGFWWVK